MSLTIMPFVQQTLVRYVLSTFFALGLIGNLGSSIVFLTQSYYRRVPCSIYLLAISIFANLSLLWSVTPSLYTLDHIDPQKQSVLYCKIRLYGGHVFGQLYRYTIMLAAADRYFITRTSARIRSWSSVAVARRLIFIIGIVWLAAGSHLLVFMEIRAGMCSQFDFYKLFYSIYQTITVALIPQALMVLFGLLTVRSLHQRHLFRENLRQKDREMMRMVIAEIAVNIITVTPYSANLLYGSATYSIVTDSVAQLEIQSFLNSFVQLLIFLSFTSPFYLYLLTSKSFRRETAKTIIAWRTKFIRRGDRVQPISR